MQLLDMSSTQDSQMEDDAENYVLAAGMENARILSNILQVIFNHNHA